MDLCKNYCKCYDATPFKSCVNECQCNVLGLEMTSLQFLTQMSANVEMLIFLK